MKKPEEKEAEEKSEVGEAVAEESITTRLARAFEEESAYRAALRKRRSLCAAFPTAMTLLTRRDGGSRSRSSCSTSTSTSTSTIRSVGMSTTTHFRTFQTSREERTVALVLGPAVAAVMQRRRNTNNRSAAAFAAAMQAPGRNKAENQNSSSTYRDAWKKQRQQEQEEKRKKAAAMPSSLSERMELLLGPSDGTQQLPFRGAAGAAAAAQASRKPSFPAEEAPAATPAVDPVAEPEGAAASEGSSLPPRLRRRQQQQQQQQQLRRSHVECGKTIVQGSLETSEWRSSYPVASASGASNDSSDGKGDEEAEEPAAESPAMRYLRIKAGVCLISPVVAA